MALQQGQADGLCGIYRLGYCTAYVKDACEDLCIRSFSELVDRVVSKGGSIIASADRRNHWLLVYGGAGNAVVLDSAAQNEAVSNYNPKQRSLTRNAGVIILPRNRAPIEIDL